ncbi:MAG: UDP-N-acetylglucosamine 2-epimerase (non-hydrolyzing) [Bacteroidetes bacterium]|nr:UDP-N-acetylglucosamine 2-epimerase (non-hydrolyzing) [Bacteroidota bacterium]MDA1126858.1 UDP-N-acetylglucosamine 2-epimerase (non-hydrolyzing) [Bacteroidota bacterium]
MKILTVLGARPQFIKAASLSRYIKKSKLPIQEIIVHTGQHYDKNMSDVFFHEMNIPKPNYILNSGSLSHAAMTAQIMIDLERIVEEETPDWVLVYGDTNSTLAGALVASKLHVKLAHVEAGLRSFNMAMPEEVNRILTDRVSNLLFCPTDGAVQNLRKEGFENFKNSHIICSGDIMLEGVNYYREKSESMEVSEDYLLCTIHRAENTDNEFKLRSIINALNELSASIQIVLPLHPRTRKKLFEFGIELKFPSIDPIGYLKMIDLIRGSRMVLTDSGGLQKEAYMLGKYCITLREETEWVELVDNGYNILVGSDKDLITKTTIDKLQDPIEISNSLYGDGNTSKIIIDSMISMSAL